MLELEREGAPVEVKILHAGYVTQKRKVERTDAKVAIALEKLKVTAAPANPTNTTTEDTDDTMDPFHRKKH